MGNLAIVIHTTNFPTVGGNWNTQRLVACLRTNACLALKLRSSVSQFTVILVVTVLKSVLCQDNYVEPFLFIIDLGPRC